MTRVFFYLHNFEVGKLSENEVNERFDWSLTEIVQFFVGFFIPALQYSIQNLFTENFLYEQKL